MEKRDHKTAQLNIGSTTMNLFKNKTTRMLLYLRYLLLCAIGCTNEPALRHTVTPEAQFTLSHAMVIDSTYIESDSATSLDVLKTVFYLKIKNIHYDTIYVVSNTKVSNIEALAPDLYEEFENGVNTSNGLPFYNKVKDHQLARGDSLSILLSVGGQIPKTMRILNHYYFEVDSSGTKKKLDMQLWSHQFTRYPTVVAKSMD